MAEDPKIILAMTDRDLQEWALSGDVGSYVHELGQTAMNMRCALRTAEASREMANSTKDLVASTGALVKQTQRLVKATWGLVLITIVTQILLLLVSLSAKSP